jgi:hypothetical protein
MTADHDSAVVCLMTIASSRRLTTKLPNHARRRHGDEYHGHGVWLLWQSKQARTASSRVSDGRSIATQLANGATVILGADGRVVRSRAP